MENNSIQIIREKDYSLFIVPILKSLDQLKSNVILDLESTEHLKTIKSEKRICEWLSVRYWLQKKLEYSVQIGYTKYGKPFLKESNLHISITHTDKYIAFILSTAFPVAIDIEKCKPRIKELSHKFVRNDELLSFSDNERYYTLIWCAKEVMYKHYEIGNLDFIENIKITFENGIQDNGSFQGQIIKNKVENYTLKYTFFDGYCLVWSIYS